MNDIVIENRDVIRRLSQEVSDLRKQRSNIETEIQIKIMLMMDCVKEAATEVREYLSTSEASDE